MNSPLSLPSLTNFNKARVANSLYELVGETPLLRLKRHFPNHEVYIKLEYMNPTCSVKDRPAFIMLTSMLECGEIAPGDTVVGASGGNFAQGLVAAAVPMGLRVIITAPSSIGEKRAQLIRAYGAEVHLCDSTISPPNAPGGYQAVAKELAENLNIQEQKYGRKCVYLDQFSDHRNSKSHHDTTGMEIVRQLNGRVGAYFGVVGTGGTVVGTGRLLKKQCKTRIIGVDVKGGIIKAR